MCGIAGLFCQDPSCRGESHEALVRGMCDIQAHRGPDDQGVASLGPACLGARRLSIIDLSPAGHMPMSDPTGRWWITYNGEVYNFPELRSELERLGHAFRSRTDTEVVLHSFMEWDERCIERFIGMFAFAIYDRDQQKLILARDRYGIKPLYYARSDGHVLVSSEIKALARVIATPSLDSRRLMEWFLYRDVDSRRPETLIEGVSSVLPGRLVTITAEGITVKQVYDFASHVSKHEFERFTASRREEVIDEVDTTLCEATRLRLVSDVPVGTLLSGGLDSSLITAIAARTRRDLTAFHVSVAGFPDLDEKRFAQELARSLNLEMVTYDLTGEAFRQELVRAAYYSDSPLSHPNSVAYLLISQVAREHGVVVLLSGEGSDELFGGYAWNYRRRWYFSRLAPLLERLPQRAWGAVALFTYARMGMPIYTRAFQDLLPPTISLIDRYERSGWLAECEDVYSFVDRAASRNVLGAMLADLDGFLSPLLQRLDRMTMAASVECRVPYLDHRIVHKAINFPLTYRIGARSEKWILKKVAARYIPRQLIHRRKAGFPLPFRDYLAPLADPRLFADGFCQEHLGYDPRGMRQFLASWDRWVLGFFGLLMLEIWGRLFIRRESLEQVQEHVLRIESGTSSR